MGNFAGLDVGTGAIKLVAELPGGAKTFSMRNVFLEVPQTGTAKQMLKQLKAPVFEFDKRTYLAGDAAYNLAQIFGKELRRPMRSGVINASVDNQDAVAMIGAMIERLMKEAGPPGPGAVCAYSCPADPVDIDLDSKLHSTLIEAKLRQLGWEPKMVYEAHAVVLSELGNDDFTGIGISAGAGMVNLCAAYMGQPVITFSSCRSGDYIDQRAAQRLGLATPRITAIKEEASFSLSSKQESLEHIAIAAYYSDMIAYVLSHAKRRLELGGDMPRFTKPITVAVGGGTAKVAGFVEVFKQEFMKAGFPIPLKDVVLAKDPTFSAARGCLVSAAL